MLFSNPIVWVALGLGFVLWLAISSFHPAGTRSKRVLRASVPIAAGFAGLVMPALGYFSLVAGHPRTLSDWQWWAFLCIPVSALLYGDPDPITFAVITFLNVAVWVGVVLGGAYLLHLLPPPAVETAA